MPRVVVIGGGWAGCAAALAAVKAGAREVTLLERADMLLGTGLVGGIMRNNGRYTAAEEALALGCGDLFATCDACARHVGVSFPGHRHATLYDVGRIEPAVRRVLDHYGVKTRTLCRVTDVLAAGDRIVAVVTDRREKVYGDAFVETTGTCGPQANCRKWGRGCAMCVYRCPSFGPRVSVAAKAGVREFVAEREGGAGAMSGSCKLHKDSLAPEIGRRLDESGVVVLPVPPGLQKGPDALAAKACQQYALPAYNENIVLLDTGYAKMMTSFFPLAELRRVPGLENARYADPYAGGIGNSMRFLAVSPRDDTLRVRGLANLFCGGEKAGILVGHTEAIVTGSLAGRNAVLAAAGREPLTLPAILAIGDIIAFSNKPTPEGLRKKYTFAGSQYFGRMRKRKLYTTDRAVIRERVNRLGLAGVFERRAF